MLKQSLTFVLLLLLGTSLAHASSINVQPMLASMTPDQHYIDLYVKNVGSDRAYATVKVYRVFNPGMANQKVTLLKDNPYGIGLIASPSKLIIPPGQIRHVRLLYVKSKPIKQDQVFYIVTSPAEGELVQVAESNDGKKVTKQVAKSGLQVVLAYKTKLFVRPDNAKPNIVSHREGKQLIIENKGNTNVYLGKFKQCEGKHCTALPSLVRRMYAGNTWKITLPKAIPVTFIQVWKNQKSTLTTH